MTDALGPKPLNLNPLLRSPTAQQADANVATSTVVPAGGGWNSANVQARVIDQLSAHAANAIKNARPSDVDLVPGRYPDAAPLTTVLSAVGQSPQGKTAIMRFLESIKAKTGVEIPAEVRAAAVANPASIVDALEITPAQLRAGVAALNAAYKAGKVPPTEPPKQLLPQKFNLADLAAVDAPRPKAEMKELAPGLYTGDLPSTTSDEQVKKNRVMAEVFQRLSTNVSAAEGEKFEVTFGGKAFTRLEDFVGALKDAGYNVDVRFDSRIANFANLKTTVPGTNPPQYLDVPAPLMLKTGVRDALGKEQAIVPATHSEMVISINSIGAAVKEPGLDTEIKFFQGMSGTGFFPAKVWADPTWCGMKTTHRAYGNDAVDAVKYAAAFTDLIGTTARKLGLYADGYGLTGVCNDSVAVVEQAVIGEATQYPLLMKDSLLLPSIEERLKDSNHADDALWRGLKKAIHDLPSDVRDNKSDQQRALASLPWEPGAEPFASTIRAREILSR